MWLRAGVFAALLLILTTGLAMFAKEQGESWTAARQQMVARQIRARGIADARILGAMEEVPRHRFVAESHAGQAYDDHPLPIGHGQTISQPYIVALMTDLLALPSDASGSKILEIGTGSGYHAAVMSRVAGEVYSIEIIPPLSERAARVLSELGYDNVHLKVGDGYQGWPEEAPFDGIVLTAAPPAIPEPLIEQLAPGGRMVVPVGDDSQDLKVLTRTATGVEVESIIPVRFVPMTGEAQKRGDG